MRINHIANQHGLREWDNLVTVVDDDAIMDSEQIANN
jgi:hypothetical protein